MSTTPINIPHATVASPSIFYKIYEETVEAHKESPKTSPYEFDIPGCGVQDSKIEAAEHVIDFIKSYMKNNPIPQSQTAEHGIDFIRSYLQNNPPTQHDSTTTSRSSPRPAAVPSNEARAAQIFSSTVEKSTPQNSNVKITCTIEGNIDIEFVKGFVSQFNAPNEKMPHLDTTVWEELEHILDSPKTKRADKRTACMLMKLDKISRFIALHEIFNISRDSIPKIYNDQNAIAKRLLKTKRTYEFPAAEDGVTIPCFVIKQIQEGALGKKRVHFSESFADLIRASNGLSDKSSSESDSTDSE